MSDNNFVKSKPYKVGGEWVVRIGAKDSTGYGLARCLLDEHKWVRPGMVIMDGLCHDNKCINSGLVHPMFVEHEKVQTVRDELKKHYLAAMALLVTQENASRANRK